MSDLVGNPEDRFSQNEAHLAADKFQTVETPAIIFFFSNNITKTCPFFKHQIFHGCKKKDFQMKTFYVFIIFAQNTDCVYTLEPPQLEPPHIYVLEQKNAYPCKPQFFYIKVGV